MGVELRMEKLFQNTPGRAVRDPAVTEFQGKYYLCYAAVENKSGRPGICIADADNIQALSVAEDHFVYLAEKDHPWSEELWAPELHFLDGSWWVYVACDDGHNENHRMYVLGNHSQDPMAPYALVGKIADATDKWAIDGTVFSHQNCRYFVWSGWEGDENVAQNLYIARMKNPYTLASERVLLSSPEQPWEQKGGTGTPDGLPFINEGPFAFTLDSDTYLAYSASGSWCAEYCIAYLKLMGNDPMNPYHWRKCEEPILTENDVVKGAGHCTMVPTDTGHLVFFHAWDKRETDVRWNTVNTYCGKLVRLDGKLSIV